MLVFEISITPLNFFPWSYIKGRFFAIPISDVKVLKAEIQVVVCTAAEVILQNSWQELDLRLGILQVTQGAHVKTD